MKVCKYCGCDKEEEAEKYKKYEPSGDGFTIKVEYHNLPSWFIDAPKPLRPFLKKSLLVYSVCSCPCHFKIVAIYLKAVKAIKEILGIHDVQRT